MYAFYHSAIDIKIFKEFIIAQRPRLVLTITKMNTSRLRKTRGNLPISSLP